MSFSFFCVHKKQPALSLFAPPHAQQVPFLCACAVASLLPRFFPASTCNCEHAQGPLRVIAKEESALLHKVRISNAKELFLPYMKEAPAIGIPAHQNLYQQNSPEPRFEV